MKENKSQEEIKKIESKKFLKIYMATLFAIVTLLITLSYFSQDKLNDQINDLQVLVDTTEQKVEGAINRAETLQNLTSEQEKKIKEQEQTISEMQEFEIQIKALDKFWRLQKLYYAGNFEQCIPFVRDIYVNFYDSLTLEAKVEFDNIQEQIEKKGLISSEELAKLKEEKLGNNQN